jgi:hypothetical protein
MASKYLIAHSKNTFGENEKMKKVILTLLVLVFSTAIQANEPAQVMLIGTFHFDNPGKDVAKVNDFDVFTEESQQYLQSFTQRLADFKPTHILLEYNPENEELINQRYQEYLAGEYELGGNEIYQLGFRIAKAAGLKTVQSFDHRDLHWNPQPMFEYAEQHNSPELKAFNDAIDYYVKEDNKARASLGLRELLMRSNDSGQDRHNMDMYLATNPIGVRDGYAGADATASWWQRNFRMYANIQQVAKPGERVIAIGGLGHTAILKQLLEIDQRLEGIKVDGYF